jgi:two-component system chemotaxis sensor kinase CheA
MALRARAVDSGLVAPDIAEAADNDTLLTLLFWPGFSTRDSSDLLAGRGIGLDIARSAIQRLGGAIRLSSRAREGFTARIDMPLGGGLATVLWVTAAGSEYAIPSANVGVVDGIDHAPSARPPHLAALLDAHASERARLRVELRLQGEGTEIESVAIGVDGVGRTEELLIRPLTPLVAGLGPFAGAIVRGDGSLRLALDAFALAPRARALGRMPDLRPSERPSGRPRA